MSEKKTYLAVELKNSITHLRVEVYYSLGGLNLATYKQEPRGYYLSVSPVKRWEENSRLYEMSGYGSGVKQLVLPVNRQSEKRMAEAIGLAAELQPQLVAHVLDKQGLTLAA